MLNKFSLLLLLVTVGAIFISFKKMDDLIFNSLKYPLVLISIFFVILQAFLFIEKKYTERYFQYGKNSTNNIREQILDLNVRVIEWSVPEIISNYKQSQQYLKDISTLPEPLDRSILPSKKGTKTLNITNMY